jgi:hypothetical protein
MALRGEFLGHVVERDRLLYPTQIKPIHNDYAAIRRLANGSLEYRFYGSVVPLADVVHVRFQSTPGNIRGLNPIQVCAMSFGLAIAQDRYAESFFLNSATPRGVIQVPGSLDLVETKKMLRSWLAAHQGINQANLPAILTEGSEFKPITISPNDSQLLEALQFSESRVCGRIFRVPPHMVGIVERTTCLPADALVFTTEGPKPIAEIEAGEEVWSLGDEGVERATVLAQEMTGVEPLLTIETIGRSVRLTANHVLPVRRYFGTDDGRKNGECGFDDVWVRADEVRSGDYLMLAHGFGGEDGEDTAPNGRPLTVEAMELCGLYIGDGSQDGRRVEIAHGRGRHGDHIPYYSDAIRREFGVEPYGDPARKGVMTGTRTRFSSRDAEELLDLGFRGKALTKRVPGWVFGLRRDLQVAFIRGYLDADGSVNDSGGISFASANPALLEDVRHLCIQVGFPVGRVHLAREAGPGVINGRRIYSHAKYHLVLGTRSSTGHPGSNSVLKATRLATVRPHERQQWYDEGWTGTHTHRNRRQAPGYGWDRPGLVLQRVRRIVRGRVAVPVYDLSVSGAHTFFAEGGVGLHNSWGRLPRYRAAGARIPDQHPSRLPDPRSRDDERSAPRRAVRSL